MKKNCIGHDFSVNFSSKVKATLVKNGKKKVKVGYKYALGEDQK